MDNKFPKSKLGFQCIGPCYEANTVISHPIDMRKITTNVPFCPTEGYKIVDRKTGEEEVKFYDECYAPTENTDSINNDLSAPDFYFNCTHFLNFYYKLSSFDLALDWIHNNENKPVSTRARIMNCAWAAYSDEVKIIDDRLIPFYIETIKKIWIKDIFRQVSKYILIDDNSIKIGESSENKRKFRVEKINYFLKKFVNHSTLYEFLDNYVQNTNDLNTTFGGDIIKEAFIKYVINKIQLVHKK